MADQDQPWWKKALPAAILAAAIPVATLVQGWLQKDRELALQEKEQIQQFRAQYMTVVSEAGVEGIEVLSDFIADTEQDPLIREWANKQRGIAREKIAALDKRIEDDQKAIKAAEDLADAATKKMNAAEQRSKSIASKAKDDQAARETAEREAEAARQALAKAQANVAVSQAKMSRSKNALGGNAGLVGRIVNPPKPAPLAPGANLVFHAGYRALQKD